MARRERNADCTQLRKHKYTTERPRHSNALLDRAPVCGGFKNLWTRQSCVTAQSGCGCPSKMALTSRLD